MYVVDEIDPKTGTMIKRDLFGPMEREEAETLAESVTRYRSRAAHPSETAMYVR